MPQNSTDPRQQFDTVEELLTRWLRERRDLLGKYTGIVVALDGGALDTHFETRQKALCDVLVDYVSAGHFEVFNELLNEAETFADGSERLAGQLIPAIADTTDVILAYEEKYGNGHPPSQSLERDLSALGEVLESRFVLEDRLIAGLHGKHRRLVRSQAPDLN